MKLLNLYYFITLGKYFINAIKYKHVYHSSYLEKPNIFFINNFMNKNIKGKKKHIEINNKTNTTNLTILNNKINLNDKLNLTDTETILKKNLFSFTKTKQIATIGPSTETFEKIEKLFLNGIDIFRLNFSHGLRNEKKYIINCIKILEKKYKSNIAILGDIQGPKIRIGDFVNTDINEKNNYIILNKGDIFNFDLSDELGNKHRVQLNYPEILKKIKENDIILLDDGNLKMKVLKNNYQENKNDISITTEVITGGKLYSKKGFTIPNMVLPINVLSEKDIKDVIFCINEGVDFIGYSFVQTEYDLIFLRNIINDYYNSEFYKKREKNRISLDINNISLKDKDDENDFYIKEVNDYYENYYIKNLHKYQELYNKQYDIKNYINNEQNIFIISKIEKPMAIKNIENIIKLSDAIMIARGDLGIELNYSKLPIIQKKIINLCRIKYNKPVIVATQMLESMRFNPLPTRAEITDVSTALHDGSDCVMLSAETATGKYPILAVETQNNIIEDVEKDKDFYYYIQNKNKELNTYSNTTSNDDENDSYFDKFIYSIKDISNNMNLKSIVLFSNEFQKIQKLSNLRINTPIIVITNIPELARKLQIAWGIYPYLDEENLFQNLNENNLFQLINYACLISKQEGFVQHKDEYSLVTFSKNINNANLLYLCKPMDKIM